MKSRCAARSASVMRRRERRRPLAHNRNAVLHHCPDGLFGKAKLRLARADQLDIDLGENFRVEQRAVLGAPRIVDAVART